MSARACVIAHHSWSNQLILHVLQIWHNAITNHNTQHCVGYTSSSILKYSNQFLIFGPSPHWRLKNLPVASWFSFKENPNFQSILNWIIQIMHYYCRKQHKNIGNSQIIEQNVVIYLCPSLCLLRLLLPSPSSTAEFFQFLDTVLREYSANFKPLPPIFQQKTTHSYLFLNKNDQLPHIFEQKQPIPHFFDKTTHSHPRALLNCSPTHSHPLPVTFTHSVIFILWYCNFPRKRLALTLFPTNTTNFWPLIS